MLQLSNKFIAVNQYGDNVLIKNHPRKELSEKYPGAIKKMFIDVAGKPHHVGYVVGEYWFNIYQILPFKTEEE